MPTVLDLAAPTATDDGRAFELLARERAGLAASEVSTAQERFGLDAKSLAALLGVDVRTLQRRRQRGEALTPRESSTFLAALRVLLHGAEVFGDDEKLSRWLRRPNQSLDGEVPLELLATSTGQGLVRDTLTRIDYGVFG